MNPILKNVLAVIAGIILGSIVNIGLVQIGHALVSLPEGVNTNDMESLAEGMKLLDARHFLFPFLAHALGTLAGAFVAAKLAASNAMKLAVGIGALFFLGGIYAAYMLPAPLWFEILDLVVAYIPMAWLGGRMANNEG